MVISGDLVKINGVKIPYIQEYMISRAKLWKDADRNMNGDVRATLIGIFPKIKMRVGYTNVSQMAQLNTLLDSAYFTVEYYDPRISATVIAPYYASDYDTKLNSKLRGLYEPFDVNLVPVSRINY